MLRHHLFEWGLHDASHGWLVQRSAFDNQLTIDEVAAYFAGYAIAFLLRR